MAPARLVSDNLEKPGIQSVASRFGTYLARHEHKLYVTLFCLLALSVWCVALPTSLTLDETGTVWTISKGFREIVTRSIHFPQSILYSILVGAVTFVAGMNEMALRLPSLIATISACYLIYRIVFGLLDKTTGLLAALIWALLPVSTDFATVARPYAFGSLAVIASYWALVRWMNAPTTTAWVLCVSLIALPVYFSYFYIVILAAQATYLVAQLAKLRMLPKWQLICGPFCIALLLAPLLRPILASISTRAIHTYLGTPSVKTLIYEFFPHAFAFGLVASFLICAFLGHRVHYRPVPMSPENSVLLISWMVVPIGCLYAISLLTPTKVFAPRYFMAASPGLAILFAWLVRGFEPAFYRSILITLVAFFSVIGPLGAGNYWHARRYGDFRAASTFIVKLHRIDVPVYAFSGFVEAAHMSFPVTEYDRTCLLAPLLMYPIGTDATILPSALNAGTMDYVHRVLDKMRAEQDEFLLYTGNPHETPDWFSDLIDPLFRHQVLHYKDDVSVIRFIRR